MKMKQIEVHRKVSRNMREIKNLRVDANPDGSIEITIPHSYLVAVDPVEGATFKVDITDFVVLAIRPGRHGVWLRSPYRAGERAYRQVHFFKATDEVWVMSLGLKLAAKRWVRQAKVTITSGLNSILAHKADNHQFLS